MTSFGNELLPEDGGGTPLATEGASETPLWMEFLSGLEAAGVNDQAIINGLWINGSLGLFMIAVFLLMRPWHVVYSTRLLDPGIGLRPPKIPSKNLRWLWAWILPIFCVSEQEVLDSAGLDALMYLRILRLGIHFFIPVTAVAFLTLVPIHITQGSTEPNASFVDFGGVVQHNDFNSSTPFTSISMVQMPKGSTVLWYHVFFVHMVVCWACLLCYLNYGAFVVLRHNYLGRVIPTNEVESARQLELRTDQCGLMFCDNCFMLKRAEVPRPYLRPGGGQNRASRAFSSSAASTASQASSSNWSYMGIATAAAALSSAFAPRWPGNDSRSREEAKQRRLLGIINRNSQQSPGQSPPRPEGPSTPSGKAPASPGTPSRAPGAPGTDEAAAEGPSPSNGHPLHAPKEQRSLSRSIKGSRASAAAAAPFDEEEEGHNDASCLRNPSKQQPSRSGNSGGGIPKPILHHSSSHRHRNRHHHGATDQQQKQQRPLDIDISPIISESGAAPAALVQPYWASNPTAVTVGIGAGGAVVGPHPLPSSSRHNSHSHSHPHPHPHPQLTRSCASVPGSSFCMSSPPLKPLPSSVSFAESRRPKVKASSTFCYAATDSPLPDIYEAAEAAEGQRDEHQVDGRRRSDTEASPRNQGRRSLTKAVSHRPKPPLSSGGGQSSKSFCSTGARLPPDNLRVSRSSNSEDNALDVLKRAVLTKSTSAVCSGRAADKWWEHYGSSVNQARFRDLRTHHGSQSGRFPPPSSKSAMFVRGASLKPPSREPVLRRSPDAKYPSRTSFDSSHALPSASSMSSATLDRRRSLPCVGDLPLEGLNDPHEMTAAAGGCRTEASTGGAPSAPTAEHSSDARQQPQGHLPASFYNGVPSDGRPGKEPAGSEDIRAGAPSSGTHPTRSAEESDDELVAEPSEVILAIDGDGGDGAVFYEGESVRSSQVCFDDGVMYFDSDEEGDEEGDEDLDRPMITVMGKPRVLAMKTVSTNLPSGEPCRVMAQLYGVLVTGVPNMAKRREILIARQNRDKEQAEEQLGAGFDRLAKYMRNTISLSSRDLRARRSAQFSDTAASIDSQVCCEDSLTRDQISGLGFSCSSREAQPEASTPGNGYRTPPPAPQQSPHRTPHQQKLELGGCSSPPAPASEPRIRWPENQLRRASSLSDVPNLDQLGKPNEFTISIQGSHLPQEVSALGEFHTKQEIEWASISMETSPTLSPAMVLTDLDRAVSVPPSGGLTVTTKRQMKNRHCISQGGEAFPTDLSGSFSSPDLRRQGTASPSYSDKSLSEGSMANSRVDDVLSSIDAGDVKRSSMKSDSRKRKRSTMAQPLEYDIVASVFRQMFPNTFFCTIPVHNDKKVEKLLFRWNRLSRAVEVAEKKFELSGKRPTVRVGGTPLLGCGGTVMDAKEYYMEKVAEIEEEIITAREKAWRAEAAPSTFVLFYDQFSATVAAQSVIHPEDGHVFSTTPAPGPDDLNWSALWRSAKNKMIRKLIAMPFTWLIILFPAGFFSAAIQQVEIAFCSTGTETALQFCGDPNDPDSNGNWVNVAVKSPLLPALLLSLWQLLLMPHGLYFLSLFQSESYSQSQLDRKIANYFFLWGIINVFLGGMLGGMSQIVNLIVSPEDFLMIVGQGMVRSSNFFIQFVQFQTLLVGSHALVQPHGGVWVYLGAVILQQISRFLRLGLCLLDRDVAMTWTAKSIRYGREIPIHCVIFLLGLGYCTASPGILPYCSLYFCMFWMTRKYQILYVFERCYESGGLFWPLVFDFIMTMLFTFQVFMSAVFISFGASLEGGICFLTIPVPLLFFRRYCHKRFNNASMYLPLEMADRAPPAIVDPALYIPPPLRDSAAGWHPESRKAWDGYNMAAYTF